LTKGKPWSAELEKQLRDLVESKTSLSAISKLLGKPEEAVRQKIRRLGLEVVEHKKNCLFNVFFVPVTFIPLSHHFRSFFCALKINLTKNG
jgi:hypothetical protein